MGGPVDAARSRRLPAAPPGGAPQRPPHHPSGPPEPPDRRTHLPSLLARTCPWTRGCAPGCAGRACQPGSARTCAEPGAAAMPSDAPHTAAPAEPLPRRGSERPPLGRADRPQRGRAPSRVRPAGEGPGPALGGEEAHGAEDTGAYEPEPYVSREPTSSDLLPDQPGPGRRRAGVARQEEDCRALCARKGWEVIAVHPDNDVSAYSGAPRRSGRNSCGTSTAATSMRSCAGMWTALPARPANWKT